MNAKTVKRPGPDHPIKVEANPSRILVKVAGRIIADSRHALTMHEAAYTPVHYIPRDEVDMSLLERTDHASYCPYKGDASYYSIPVGAARSINSIWTYETPYEAVAQIRDHLAFYPERVDSIDVIQGD